MKNWCELDLAIDHKKLTRELARVSKMKVLRPSEYSVKDNFMVNIFANAGDERLYSPVVRSDGFKKTSVAAKTPYIVRLAESLGGPLYAVRLSGISPNSGLYFHRDTDFNFAFGIIRIHVPIISDSSSRFSVEDETFSMQTGKAYFVDISKLHAVLNSSKKMRVHLLIDVGLTPEVLRLFPRSFLKRVGKHGLRLHPSKVDFHISDRLAPAGHFRLLSKKVPNAMAARTGQPCRIERAQRSVWLHCGNAEKFQIARYNRNWLFCPSIGPGFVFKIKLNKFIYEYHGLPANARNGLTRLRTVLASVKFKPAIQRNSRSSQ